MLQICDNCFKVVMKFAKMYMFLIFNSPYTCDEINSNSLRTRRNLRVESLRSNSRAMPFCSDWIRILSDWELPSFCLKKIYMKKIFSTVKLIKQ